MTKSDGPRLPYAHPKYDPLTGTDYVRFKPPGARFSLLERPAPEGAEVNAEIKGDEVRVRAERGGRVYTVPRSVVETLSGKALTASLRRSRRRTRTWPIDAAQEAREKRRRPVPAGPGFPPIGGSRRRCASSTAGPLPWSPSRRTAAGALRRLLDFIHGFICIGCGNENRLIEAHHEGPHPLSVKTDDLLCVPLCAGLDGCHRFYTDHNHLPGRSREESLCLMEVAQRVLLVEFVRRLLALLAPPAVAAGSAADQALLDLLDEQERSFVAEGGSHA